MSQGSVLVLDNSPAHARHISKMLEAERWSSVLTFDRAMAMQALRNTRFHLLMFEAYVGQSSVLQAVGDIRARAENTPLAIMTGGHGNARSMAQTIDMAKAAGADFVMGKPFSPERLKTVLTETSAYHRARKASKTILVVEDNANLRKLITTVLGEMGYQIFSAASMEEAFEATQMGMLDVVIADIFMPGMGGIEGISHIRAAWPHIHIISMSAGMENKLDVHAVLAASRHVGAVAQLPKPFLMEDLIHVVALVLSGDAPGPSEIPPADEAKHVA
jgi:CheY-like chemotaxis protein